MAGGHGSTCLEHKELVEHLQTLITDIKWFVCIGKWLLGVLVALILALTPFVWNISSRVSNFEIVVSNLARSQADLSQALIKHIDLPAHNGSSQQLAILTSKVDSLCQRIAKLEH